MRTVYLGSSASSPTDNMSFENDKLPQASNDHHAHQDTIFRELSFYSDPPGGFIPEYIAETSDTPGQRNYEHTRVVVPIIDIRGQEREFSLDYHSFQALPGVAPSSFDFSSEEQIRTHYLPWVQHLLQQHVPGTSSIHT